MNFTLGNFIKKGLLDAIGKMADYQIILNATGWYEKGVLNLEDLEEINQAIEDSHKPQPEPQGIIESEDIMQDDNYEIEGE